MQILRQHHRLEAIRRWCFILLVGAFVFLFASASPSYTQDDSAPVQFRLQLVADGLTAPVDLKPAPDDSGRLFVVDQTGQIKVISSDGQLQDQPFLDISDRLVELNPNYDERGLLGLAFHPDFANNRRFFVYYSAPLRDGGPEGWSNTNRLSEFTVSGDGTTADPNSERVLLEIDEPQSNHNGGDITFGSDGYLYVPLGDGGGADDKDMGHTPDIGNGQDLTKLLGKVLRLDVDSGDPYGIPQDNPFADGSSDAHPEIWAWGFRNPWRMSFDAGGDNQLFVADAGQDMWEEVSIVQGGMNYGWHLLEGYHCFDYQNPGHTPFECRINGYNDEPLQLPIIEYNHQVGQVVIGGYVYRGSALGANYQGKYIFGEWSPGKDAGYYDQAPHGMIMVATAPPEGDDVMWKPVTASIAAGDGDYATTIDHYILSFGQDNDNELYALTSDTLGPSGDTGKVWRLTADNAAQAEATQSPQSPQETPEASS